MRGVFPKATPGFEPGNGGFADLYNPLVFKAFGVVLLYFTPNLPQWMALIA